MAYLRLGHIKEHSGSGGKAKGLMKCITYILNPQKTNNQEYVGAHNFILNTADKGSQAFDTMMNTKRFYGKEDGRQGYHFKLSFAENDKVTPELALKLTEEFCERCFTDYECLYAVHNNTKHLHSHIVINSIDIVEGLKYRYEKGDWAKKIQPIVNDICKKNDLSEIDLSMDEDFIMKHKCKVYETKDKIFYSNKMIKADVDEAISIANDYNEFLMLLRRKGFEIKEGEHISVRAPGRDRYCRLYNLTTDKQTYTRDNIIRMIEGTFLKPEDVREQLVKDWNSYSVVRIKVHITRVDNKLAKELESRSFADAKQLHNIDAVEYYMYYLNLADKELNILRKKISESLEQRAGILSDVTELSNLMKYYVRYENGDERFKAEYDKVKSLYNNISSAGYNLTELYRYKVTGESLIRNIDNYKKHLYVEKKICERIKDDLETRDINKVKS